MGDKLAAVFPAILVCAVASVPILVATGTAPRWFWIFF